MEGYKALMENVCCYQISQETNIPIQRIRKKWYCSTSSMGEQVYGYECTPLATYRGPTPLKYMEYYEAVKQGKKQRGYSGMQVTHKKHSWVIIGKQVQFKPIPTGTQGTLL